MTDIRHEPVGDPYMERKLALANRYGATAANRVVAPMANAVNDAGFREIAELMRRAANTPEASTLGQLARDNQMFQGLMGGDAFRGFGNMQANSSAFMQVPMSERGPMSATMRQMGGMNRAAAISNEIMKASYGAGGGERQQFTQGLGQGELQDLATHLAQSGAEAQIGGKMVSMASGKTGAKEAAMMVSKYAKTVRTMMDTFGSRDVQEALKDYEAIVGHSLATKGDPGLARRGLDQVGSMASAMGMDARTGLQMFGGIRSQLAGANDLVNDRLYGRGVSQGAASSRVMAQAMLRANEAGVLHDPTRMGEVVKEEVARENMIQNTDGARAAKVLAALEVSGDIDPATLNRARKAFKSGDMKTFTNLMASVSEAEFGDRDAIYRMTKSDDMTAKLMTLKKAGMSAEQQQELDTKADRYKTEAHQVQMMQEMKRTDALTTESSHRRIKDAYGIDIDSDKISDASSGRTARKMESKISNLRSEISKLPAGAERTTKEAQLRDMEAGWSRFQRIEAKDGFGAAISSMDDTGAESVVAAEARSSRSIEQRLRIKGSEAFALGMRVEDVEKVTGWMNEEEQAKMKGMSKDEKAKFAYDKMVKLKGAGDAEADKLAEKVVSQKALDTKSVMAQRDKAANMLIFDEGVTADFAGSAYRQLKGLEGGELMQQMDKLRVDAKAQEIETQMQRSYQDKKGFVVKDGQVFKRGVDEGTGKWTDDLTLFKSKSQISKMARAKAKEEVGAVTDSLAITGKVEIIQDSDGTKHIKFVDTKKKKK